MTKKLPNTEEWVIVKNNNLCLVFYYLICNQYQPNFFTRQTLRPFWNILLDYWFKHQFSLYIQRSKCSLIQLFHRSVGGNPTIKIENEHFIKQRKKTRGTFHTCNILDIFNITFYRLCYSYDRFDFFCPCTIGPV